MFDNDADWWEAIDSHPFNWETALIYADWLDDQGRDLEAVQVRFATQVTSWYRYSGKPYEGKKGGIGMVLALLTDEYYMSGKVDGHARRREQDWCRRVGVPFIRFYPRSVNEIEAALQPPPPPKQKRYAVVFSGGPNDGEMKEVARIDQAIRFATKTPTPVRPMTPEEMSRPVEFHYHEYRCHSETIGHPDFTTYLFVYEGLYP